MQVAGAIAGRVVNAIGGTPIESLTLVAVGLQGSYTGITDNRGDYRIERLPAGTYTVIVDSDLVPNPSLMTA